MSAFLISQQDSAAHLLSDAAHFDVSGAITSYSSKLRVLPGCSAVMTGCGSAHAIDLIFEMSSRMRRFDDVVRHLPEATRLADRLMPEHLPHFSDAHRAFVVSIVGWSEFARMPQTYVVASEHFAAISSDAVAYSAYRLANNRQFSIPSGREKDCVSKFDPEVDGLLHFEHLRSKPMHAYSVGSEIPLVAGGFLECATVNSAGLHIRKLCDWEVNE